MLSRAAARVSVAFLASVMILGAFGVVLTPAAALGIDQPFAGPGSIDVLLRSATDGQRSLLTQSRATIHVDYGGFVLATLPQGNLDILRSRGMVLRTLEDRTQIRLGPISFDTAAGEPAVASHLRIDAYPAGESGFFLIQFIGPPKPFWISALRVQGVRFLNYVPNYAYIVHMESGLADVIRAQPFVQWVGVYQPAYRISKAIYEKFSEPEDLTAKIPVPERKAGSESARQLTLSIGAPAALRSPGGIASAAAPAAPASAPVPVTILVLAGSPFQTWQAIGGAAVDRYQLLRVGQFLVQRISVHPEDIGSLASRPGVYWIEPMYKARTLDEVSGQITAGNYNPIEPGYLAWLGGLGLSGVGINVAVADTGVDTGVDDPNVGGDMHPELDNRVVAHYFYGSLPDGSDGYGHGTHVAGIVAGDDATGLVDGDGFLYGLGVAPQAGIVNQRIFDDFGGFAFPDYYQMGIDAISSGSSVHSNSWGYTDFGDYILEDQIYDALTRDADTAAGGEQPLLFEASAGNAGWGGPGNPQYGSTGSPGNAKNVITTGASLNYRPTIFLPGEWPADNIDASIGFSSRGPTNDGRIKPELVAPGGWIASALSSDAIPGWCWENIDTFHEYCGGTSMSGPMVSGAAALFVEYYRGVTGGTDPSPALTKAALVNGAVDMAPVDNPTLGSYSTGPIPNMDEGWGRLNLGNVFAFPGTIVYDDQQHPLAIGESFSYTIAVGEVDQPFRVSLAYTDLPGMLGVGSIVNDLDLTVTAPDGTVFFGNYFQDGWSAPGGTPDSTNNLENVYIDATSVLRGVYTVTVTGLNVPEGTQDYALVVSHGGGPTSDGQVVWEKGSYRSDALATMFLLDSDLNLDDAVFDTATVVATSASGDSEDVTVTEVDPASAVFSGDIQLTLAASGPNDGVLTVADLDVITATYEDANPVGSKTDTAVIDDIPPVVSGIMVTSLTYNSARIEWLTDEPATTVLRYDTATPPGIQAVGGFGTSHAVSLPGLTPDTLYYFEVEATDEAGNTVIDDNSGSYHTFTTEPIPPILLVDDDFGNPWESYYEIALAGVGEAFVYWEVTSQGYPTLGDLSGFAVVLWFNPSCIDTSPQTAIASYLDGGGKLILSGQDIGFCSQFIPGPIMSYLHATYITDDPFTRNVIGVAGDPIGDGLAFSIAGGDGANNNFFPDVVNPIAPAEISAVYDAGPASRSALLHVDTGVYQVAYLAFNFEGISTAADRTTMMERLLDWILPPPYGIRLRPAAQGSDAVPGQTVVYRVAVQNRGVALPEDTFDLTWSSVPLGWTTEVLYSDGIPVIDTSGNGTPDTGPIPSKGSIDLLVQVTVDPGAAGGDLDVAQLVATSVSSSSATFTGSFSTLVPPPGVDVSRGAYHASSPGATVQGPLTVRNTGGLPDYPNVEASSEHGWPIQLLEADGLTPLQDNNGDGLVDVGSIGGLETIGFVVQIQVPSNAPLDTLDRVLVTTSSAANSGATDTSTQRIEIPPLLSPEWPQFHHDRERGGVNPVPFEMPLTQRWVTAASPYPIQWTGSVIADHMVFVSTGSGNLLALDIGTGAILWSTKLGDAGAISGTPAVANGNVYVAMVTGAFTTVTLFSLDEMTGAINWWVDSPVGFAYAAFTTPAVGIGNVYWDDGYPSGRSIRATDAETGDDVWTTLLPSSVLQGPTYFAGLVFAGDVSGNLVALDAFTGAVVWMTQVTGVITSAPTITNGILYVGDYSGTLYAFDALSGTTIWEASGLGALIDVSSPVVAQGLVFVGTFADFFGSAGTMYALDEGTGAVVWSYEMPGGPVGTSAAYNNGTVFLTTWDGNLWAWDAASGEVLAELPISSSGSTSSVALGDGYAIVGDQDGEITGFGFVGAGETRRVDVSPRSKDVTISSAALFQARAYDLYDNVVGGQTFEWDSLQDLGTVLPISDTSDRIVYVAGTQAGTDTLEVTSAGGVFGDATVRVLPGALDHVDVVPGVASVVAGTQMTFAATAGDRFGNTISGVTITWEVVGDIGTITSNGVFTASSTPGVGFVTATAVGKTGRVAVTIVPAAPATVDIELTSTSVSVDSQTVVVATVRDVYDNANPDGVVRWTTTGAGTILLLTPDGRAILYHAPITTTPASVQLTATIGSGASAISRTITLTIVAGPPVGIAIDAPATTVAVGGILDFDAVVTDQFGNAVTGATIAWETTGGSINQQGVFTAPSQPGLVVITASTAGRESFVVVDVTSGALEQFSRQATSATSLGFLVAALVAVAAGVFVFFRYREARRELEEVRKRGGGPGEP